MACSWLRMHACINDLLEVNGYRRALCGVVRHIMPRDGQGRTRSRGNGADRESGRVYECVSV
eukprot:6206312-Pleurochrysis_carterae.AAC.2